MEKAKNYAKDKNRSLSDIDENYLKTHTQKEKENTDKKHDPIAASLKGSFKMPKNID